MLTEQLVRERTRDQLAQAERRRYSRRLRALRRASRLERRASRLERRAERRMLQARSRSARLRGAFESADY